MEQLKRLRREQGLSQAKLAALADIDPSSMNQIERGAREPSMGTLRKLAGALEVSIGELLDESAPTVSAPPSFDDVLADERRTEADMVEHVGTLAEVDSGWLSEFLHGAEMRRVCVELLDDGSAILRGYRS